MSAFSTGTMRESGFTVVENASLDGRNTFRVRARAELLIDVRRPEALEQVLDLPYVKSNPLLVLGGGSNVLFTRDFPGTVLSVTAHGATIVEERGGSALVRVGAGENWNDFVHWSLSRGFFGLENLVLIPGSVGAAPIQNIGAYGREVREFIATIEAWDRTSGKLVRIENDACGFGYRDSLFKHEPGRHVITAVEFLMPRSGTLVTNYAGVAEELTAIGAGETPATVAEAVARLRTRKLPNPAIIGNAGSFFKNPLIQAKAAEALRVAHPELPAWPAGDGMAKMSAAWLVEASGFKGFREGDAGVSERHALVLVNHGRATGAQLWALAQRVRDGVANRFGVLLEPEPIIV